MSSEGDKTVWVGNLHERVEEDILFELFLQAGPLQHVKLPRDRTSGKKKNFAFISFQHECSVPYAIELLDDIRLYGRNIRVQSRHLQELQAEGLVPYGAGGIHTLSPFKEQSSESKDGSPQSSSASQPRSLLGNVPSLIHPHLLGNVPPHILNLAQQQMAALNANQMIPLSANPLLNARLGPRDNRYGSSNYNVNNPRSSGYEHLRYDRYQDNRNRSARTVDNKTMHVLKSRFEENTRAQNSHDLAHLQERHGHFDRNRVGSASNNSDGRSSYDREGSGRSHNRDHRQQPYERHESHHSRSHDRQSSHEGYQRRSDRRDHRSSNSYNRGHHNHYSRR